MPDHHEHATAMVGVQSAPRPFGWGRVALCVAAVLVAAVLVSAAVATAGGGPVMVPNLIVFGLPVLGYAIVRARRGDDRSAIIAKLSLGGARPAAFALAIALSLAAATAYHLVIKPVLLPLLLPADAIGNLGGAYAGLSPGPTTAALVFASEALNVALGEELLFRGLVAGWALRRFGPNRGNAVQSVIFLLPHLTVLSAGAGSWLLLPVVLVIGWTLGVLLRRSGSIWPGWLLHALANALTKMPL
ncbi:MAG TPA: CPBP family intramembrane glutamic endopeptidase [Euzebyales bacterium]|nr:CPBP family intramembrane glutamic endopeptidase [Euzebyales bacterium]